MGQRFVARPADDDEQVSNTSYASSVRTESTITNAYRPGTHTPMSNTDAPYNYYSPTVPQNLQSLAASSLSKLQQIAHNGKDVSIKALLKLIQNQTPLNFVATMGLTGHGKSTLIKLLTPPEMHTAITTNSGMAAGTTEFKMHPVFVPGLPPFILIDFPGFDSSSIGDEAVFNIIYSWFKHMSGTGVMLSTVLYVHDITAPRLTPEMEQAFAVFKALVGKENFKNIGIVGTKWDFADGKPRTRRKYLQREQELREGLWAEVIHGGGRVHQSKGVEEPCSDDTYEEDPITAEEWNHAGSFARIILETHAKDDKVRLRIQEEIKAGMSPYNTDAGRLILQQSPRYQEIMEMEAQMKKMNEANEENPKSPTSMDAKRRSEEERRWEEEMDQRGRERQEGWFKSLIEALAQLVRNVFRPGKG